MKIAIKQRDITDCGAACLASVAAWYKLALPVARIRQFAGTKERDKYFRPGRGCRKNGISGKRGERGLG